MLQRLGHTMGAYFKTQGIIIGIVAIISTLGLLVLRNPYAFLLGILIALFDAFPIVGSGSILIPWALYQLIQGNLFQAGVLALMYLLTLVIREVLEPKILGQQTGLRPIYTFVSFYIGIQLFGIIGVILGPIGMVMIQSLYSTMICPKQQSP